MSTSKINFVSDLHLACSKEGLRPVMQCVHFVDGYAYASDSNIMVKQSLDLSNVAGKEFLVDKSIHKDSFKAIRKYQYVSVNEDGFDCIGKDGGNAFFPFAQLDDPIPDFNAIMPSGLVTLGEIGINAKLLSLVSRAMACNGQIKLTFHGISKAVLIEPLQEDVADEIAIIMPCLLSQ